MIDRVRLFCSDKLVRAGSLLFVAFIVTSLFNYAFQIAMGRLLSPGEYGLLNALLAVYMVLGVPVATLLMVVARKTAEYRAEGEFAGIRNLFRQAYRKILLAGAVGLGIFAAASPWVRDYLHAPSVIPVIILGLGIFAALAYPINIAVLQGLQDYRWLGISQGMAGPVKFVLCVLLVLFGLGINGALVGLAATGLVLWLLSYLPLRRHLKTESGRFLGHGHVSFAQVLPVFLANLAFMFMTQADMVLVNRYFSPQEAGMYASAAILGKAVMYIPGSIVLAMFPMVSEKSALKLDSRPLLVKSLAMTVCLSGSGALVLFLFPSEIMNILFGARYMEAAGILRYFGLAMLPMAVLMVLMHYLIARGKILFSIIMILGAVLELVLILLFRSSPMVVVFDLLFSGGLVLLISFLIFGWRSFPLTRATEAAGGKGVAPLDLNQP